MKRQAPKFWWDFEGDAVIIRSDYPGGECLAEFTGEHAVDDASALIRDFEAGRKTPDWRRAAKGKHQSAFKVGDAVVVVDDPDVPFSGVIGTVVEIGVETMGGPGLTFESAEFGKMKGSYDCFARVQ